MSKTFFITGISSGLGLELTKQLLAKNHRVVGTYFHNSSELEVIKNPNLSYFKVDNFDYKSTAQIISQIKDIDVFINNAGVYTSGELESYDPEKIIQLINTNLTGAILTTQAVLPIMKAKNEGVIFFVNSINGVENKALSSVYGASKWGLRGFATNLRVDLKNTNIQVLNFYPAGMQTELFKNAGVDKDLENYMTIEDVATLVIDTIENIKKYIVQELVLNRWR
ncbi:MAG: SDR family NAD(P)-dependent oxidoreductase [bacterium]